MNENEVLEVKIPLCAWRKVVNLISEGKYCEIASIVDAICAQLNFQIAAHLAAAAKGEAPGFDLASARPSVPESAAADARDELQTSAQAVQTKPGLH